ncbi:MAG: 2-amino-4-hydroxy-6-hydroxymethyldihydropteridine diphosphokinase [Filomicrobium sp.]
MNDNDRTSDAFIALGSNIGDKTANINHAITLLTGRDDIRLRARSRDYRTPPWGKTDQDWFVNACIGVATSLSPHELLRRCLETEVEMGRKRAEKWGPRLIDLDVLLHGDAVLSDAELILPHPHITVRAFVLAPLADIAPNILIDGKSVLQWLEQIDKAGVEPIE